MRWIRNAGRKDEQDDEAKLDVMYATWIEPKIIQSIQSHLENLLVEKLLDIRLEVVFSIVIFSSIMLLQVKTIKYKIKQNQGYIFWPFGEIFVQI